MFVVGYDDLACPLEPGDLILVGRDDQCDLQLEDPSASRMHCRLLAKDGRVILTDAGSRWGTFVNGTRVEKCELKPGDQITVGETILTLEVASRSADETVARRSELYRPEGIVSALQQQAERVVEKAPVVLSQTEPQQHVEKTAGFDLKKAIRRDDYVGKRFGEFRVEEFLRRTSSGLLFRATWPQGEVALKLFQPTAFSTETDQQRFQRAIQVVADLQHENLVTLYSGGENEGVLFTASEFITGESAQEMIHRIGVAGMLDWRTTLQIGLDISAALVFLEDQGIVHRNITPPNVLIDSERKTAKLNDALLAKALDDHQANLTQAGETIGDLPYLSPEQVGSGDAVDHRSDIYQLGAMLFALLTGKPPFEERNPAIAIGRILDEKPEPPTKHHLAIPALLEGTILTMLEKRPVNRQQSAVQLLNDLQRVQRFLPSK